MTSTTSSSPGQHVAVFAFPFSSHPAALLSLVRRLATVAPDVSFSFLSSAKSNDSLFSNPNPNNVRRFDVSTGQPEGYVFRGDPEEVVNFFAGVAEESFKAGLQAAEAEIGRGISCLISDAFLWFCGKMAKEKGVPWVAFSVGGPCSISAHLYTDLIRETLETRGIARNENENLDFVPGFPSLRLGDLPGGIVLGNLESPFSNMLHRMGQNITAATAVAVNSFEELEPDINRDLKSKLSNYLNIGPFNLTFSTPPPLSDKDDPSGCIKWLNRHEKATAVYICFGTIAAPPPHELVALAEALEETGAPFLWSIRDDLKRHFPDEFLERVGEEKGKVVPWAPQPQVLAHDSVGVFVNHTGRGSVLESIVAGVPMIGRPFLGDNHLNVGMVEKDWQIGLRVEGDVLTKNGLVGAIRQVLTDEKGKRIKERIGHLKELAFEAAGPNGSSTKNFKTLVKIVTGQDL